MNDQLKDNKNKFIVIKIGGSTLGETDSTITDIVSIKNSGLYPVVIHGGGKLINEWVAKQGIMPEFVNGLRRTNKQTLDVAIAVLTGLINSELVVEFQKLNQNAIGLSGLDGGILKASKKSSDLGYVGEILETDISSIKKIVKLDLIPIIAPAAINIYPNNKNDLILNINADTAAGHIAKALNAKKLIFQTDVPGIMDMRKRTIPHMTSNQASDLIASGVAIGGMIPKIQACVFAIKNIGSGHIIDGRINGSLNDCILGKKIGTKIS
ncbi:MAG: acetylglutamate kinase [Chloroflexi bacterium]|nr:acetylglutamate kinase [Chloroflexota bacterium]